MPLPSIGLNFPLPAACCTGGSFFHVAVQWIECMWIVPSSGWMGSSCDICHGHQPAVQSPHDCDCGTICAPSLMAVVGQYVQWAGKAGRRMPRLLCYWLMGATENAGVENVARSDTGGKRGSNQHRTLRKCNEASQAGLPRKMYEQRMSHPADN